MCSTILSKVWVRVNGRCLKCLCNFVQHYTSPDFRRLALLADHLSPRLCVMLL